MWTLNEKTGDKVLDVILKNSRKSVLIELNQI